MQDTLQRHVTTVEELVAAGRADQSGRREQASALKRLQKEVGELHPRLMDEMRTMQVDVEERFQHVAAEIGRVLDVVDRLFVVVEDLKAQSAGQDASTSIQARAGSAKVATRKYASRYSGAY